MKWAIVVNPYSGKRKALGLAQEFKRLAELANIESIWISGATALDSIAELHDAISSGAVVAVVVVGGDGLVNLAIQELAGGQIPLAVLAAGTGNDFARTNGTFRSSPQELIDLMMNSAPTAIDLGLVSIGGGLKWFGQILSTGFDSLVNERANRFKRIHGKMKYNVATIIELPRFSPKEYVIVADGRKITTRAMLVAVANGPTYGGGMRVLPNADRHDGRFDILILHPLPKLEFIRVFPKVFNGTHITHPKVEIIRAREVSIAADARVYADGEDFGMLPMSVETISSTLRTWLKS
jgi:diacylglycerol kinase (ATP)